MTASCDGLLVPNDDVATSVIAFVSLVVGIGVDVITSSMFGFSMPDGSVGVESLRLLFAFGWRRATPPGDFCNTCDDSASMVDLDLLTFFRFLSSS